MDSKERKYKDCKFGNAITQCDIVPYIVEHWTEEEKKKLLVLMKKHRSKNHDAIAADLLGKTKQEVREAIEYYHKTAFKIHGSEMGRRGRELRPKDINKAKDLELTFWINSLIKTYPSTQLAHNDNLATALTIIAENNNFPLPEFAHEIEFKKLYLNIAQALLGKQGPSLNNMTALVLKKMIKHCMCESQRSLLYTNIEPYLNLMKRPHESVLPIRGVASNQKHLIMEYILSQRWLNPFGLDLETLNVQIAPEPEYYDI